jgi:hypothetical protein
VHIELKPLLFLFAVASLVCAIGAPASEANRPIKSIVELARDVMDADEYNNGHGFEEDRAKLRHSIVLLRKRLHDIYPEEKGGMDIWDKGDDEPEAQIHR